LINKKPTSPQKRSAQSRIKPELQTKRLFVKSRQRGLNRIERADGQNKEFAASPEKMGKGKAGENRKEKARKPRIRSYLKQGHHD